MNSKGCKPLEEVIAYITKGHAILNSLENMKIPVVACIHGNCLGGGLELALVCNYRMAVDSPQTVLGFPEVQLGLLPAAGGTQRLPRLIGLTAALPLLLTARNLRAKQAKRAGLVDELIPPYGAKETAVQEGAGTGQEREYQKKAQTLFCLFPSGIQSPGKVNSFFAGQKNGYAPDLRLLSCTVCHH